MLYTVGALSARFLCASPHRASPGCRHGGKSRPSSSPRPPPVRALSDPGALPEKRRLVLLAPAAGGKLSPPSQPLFWPVGARKSQVRVRTTRTQQRGAGCGREQRAPLLARAARRNGDFSGFGAVGNEKKRFPNRKRRGSSQKLDSVERSRTVGSRRNMRQTRTSRMWCLNGSSCRFTRPSTLFGE